LIRLPTTYHHCDHLSSSHQQLTSTTRDIQYDVGTALGPHLSVKLEKQTLYIYNTLLTQEISLW